MVSRSAVAVCVYAAFAGLLGGCGSPASGPSSVQSVSPSARAPSPQTPSERLAIFMAGSYSTAEQAAADPEYRVILLQMKRIWRERADGPWLYVEQAMAEQADKPYRQRIYRLVDLGDGRLRSDVYTLPGDPLRFAGEWKRANPLPDILPDALVLRDGCSLTLVESPTGEFVGATDGRACPSELRGASYATSEATITPLGMVSWDRGFDAAGTQVWGAEKGGYRFKKSLPW
ncbi:MAG: chromophore lyase CpcT/CpeT [Phycisphaerales bacterium]